MIMDYKYSYDKKEFSKEQYNQIFDVDLLIIDDLGTEMKSDNKFTELFNIINTRQLKNKKIVISTNLTLTNIFEIYDKRTGSRLVGNFIICKFIGEDIRLMKKKIN
jgi:DNA replication protein DnaC